LGVLFFDFVFPSYSSCLRGEIMFPNPILISASRRTDIPAFFTPWFQERLNAGYCETQNPFSKKTSRVSLKQEDVLGWIFWSRNYAPFLKTLHALHAQGQRFLCHLTITNYPRALESHTPHAALAIEAAFQIARAFSPDVLQWRYDPIILTSITPPEWHLRNFETLSAALEGNVRRCIFSFPTLYRKTARNLSQAECDGGFQTWSLQRGDFCKDDLQHLAHQLAAIAASHGMQLLTCCNDEWLTPDIGKAHCVDWPLLKTLLLQPSLVEPSLHPTRSGCGCFKSVDIGAYDTCQHGCCYCYATRKH
jgi:hypothetical protein